jgi:hypothetical protein
MSSLVKVLSLSVTMACTVGLEPLMFPPGLTDVMVTPPPLEPPRPGLDLAPDLVLGLALCEVFRLLDLPTRSLLYPSLSMLSYLAAAILVSVSQTARIPGLLPPGFPASSGGLR